MASSRGSPWRPCAGCAVARPVCGWRPCLHMMRLFAATRMSLTDVSRLRACAHRLPRVRDRVAEGQRRNESPVRRRSHAQKRRAWPLIKTQSHTRVRLRNEERLCGCTRLHNIAAVKQIPEAELCPRTTRREDACREDACLDNKQDHYTRLCTVEMINNAVVSSRHRASFSQARSRVCSTCSA